MTKLLASALFAATLIAAPAVHAVDIENQDAVDHQVTIAIGDGGPTTFTLKAGEKKSDVCRGEHCTLMLNNSEWDGLGDERVIVKDGKMNLPSRSPRG